MVKKVIVNLDFNNSYCFDMVTRNISSFFVGVFIKYLFQPQSQPGPGPTAYIMVIKRVDGQTCHVTNTDILQIPSFPKCL